MPELPGMSRTTDGDAAFRTGAGIPPSVVPRSDGDRVVVAVGGELCLDDCPMLERTLRAALARGAQGVDLDLRALECWDCSVLNVLLAARRQALAQHKTLTVTATGAAAERLLGLTGTRALFTSPSASSEEPEPVSGAEPAVSTPDVRAGPRCSSSAGPCGPVRRSTWPAASSWRPSG